MKYARIASPFCIWCGATNTAGLTANLTLETLRGDIQGPENLPGKRIASVAGSTSAAYIQTNRITARLFDTPAQAIEALETNKVEALVYDAPILAFHATGEGQNRTTLVGLMFRCESYGLAVQNNSL